MELTVATLNCWGIRFVSKDRVPRMDAIAHKLAAERYDFVFLQEVWTTEDYERIRKQTRNNLPYGHYFYSGVIGAGICILSKYEIKSAFFHQWAVNGYIHKIQHGDWFGGKGVGMVEVDYHGLRISLYTAHLHAEYDRKNDEYLAHRVIQSFDTAQFIRLTSQNADFVVVGGDLNTEPGDMAYKVIMHSGDLRDAALDLEKHATVLDELCGTCETSRISYTPRETLKISPNGKRIDYICFRTGPRVKAKTLSCELPWPDRVPGQPFSYSDHEAVVAKFSVVKNTIEENGALKRFPDQDTQDVLTESVGICTSALMQLEYNKKLYGVFSIICFCVLIGSTSFEFQGIWNLGFILIRVVLILILVFLIIMGTVWNRMEVNGILSGKLAMEIELGKFGRFTDLETSEDEIANGGGDQWDNSSTPRIRSSITS